MRETKRKEIGIVFMVFVVKIERGTLPGALSCALIRTIYLNLVNSKKKTFSFSGRNVQTSPVKEKKNDAIF